VALITSKAINCQWFWPKPTSQNNPRRLNALFFYQKNAKICLNKKTPHPWDVSIHMICTSHVDFNIQIFFFSNLEYWVVSCSWKSSLQLKCKLN
jgi:hypothetical protein